jgi:putative photosynthetic complex assembly protein
MTEASVRQTFPRWFLIGIGALLLTTVSFAVFGRLTGYGITRVAETAVISSVDIWFEDQDNKTMLVRRVSDNTILEVLPADGSGFMRGVVRSLSRQRLLSKIEPNKPFRLAQREDQKLFIQDMSVGSKMELDGFGPANTLSIARILTAGLKNEVSTNSDTTSKALTAPKGPAN